MTQGAVVWKVTADCFEMEPAFRYINRLQTATHFAVTLSESVHTKAMTPSLNTRGKPFTAAPPLCITNRPETGASSTSFVLFVSLWSYWSIRGNDAQFRAFATLNRHTKIAGAFIENRRHRFLRSILCHMTQSVPTKCPKMHLYAISFIPTHFSKRSSYRGNVWFITSVGIWSYSSAAELSDNIDFAGSSVKNPRATPPQFSRDLAMGLYFNYIFNAKLKKLSLTSREGHCVDFDI